MFLVSLHHSQILYIFDLLIHCEPMRSMEHWSIQDQPTKVRGWMHIMHIVKCFGYYTVNASFAFNFIFFYLNGYQFHKLIIDGRHDFFFCNLLQV